MEKVRIVPEGDSALLVEFGSTIDPAVNRRVHALAEKLRREPAAGVRETVPTYRSLLVLYDPLMVRYASLEHKLRRMVQHTEVSEHTARRILQVPCCYDGEDLPDVASLNHLTNDEVIQIHSSVVYPIYMLGFLPGFVYLGGLDGRIHTPRLASPRKAIPEGSVGIGGNQTGIYPMVSPGGWRLIGRTPLKMYDPNREEAIPVKAGDCIRFVPVGPDEFEDIRRQVESGTYGWQWSREGAVQA